MDFAINEIAVTPFARPLLLGAVFCLRSAAKFYVCKSGIESLERWSYELRCKEITQRLLLLDWASLHHKKHHGTEIDDLDQRRGP